MKKKTIPILSALMTLSFIILVGLQFYFFREVLKKSEDDFSSNVAFALENSAEKINNKELQKYYKLFGNFYNEATQSSDVATKQVVHSVVDSGDFRYIEFKNYIIERKNIPIPLTRGDTLQRTNVYTDEGSVKILRDSSVNVLPTELNSDLENTIESGEFSLQNFAKLNFNQKPINQRVNNIEIRKIIQKELKKRGISTTFAIAILNAQQKTEKDLVDKNYHTEKDKNYQTVLFSDTNNQPQYYLSIYFPSKNVSVFKPYLWPIAITLLATIIVILIYGTSIYYMNRQKKISEIKTNFINNMTHEFKTPIATINIATSALKNDNVVNNPEKIHYYSDLIQGENKRMNTQVEKILQMSRLENNQINFDWQELAVNSLIEKAIESTELSIHNRNGTIIEELHTVDETVIGDSFHLTNALVNLIDNANKYSTESPEVIIRSWVEGESVLISVSDKGIGIRPENRKKLFEKFYREEMGDVHNVKGHGLGLTYVKEIVEKHGGEITVKSEPNKGSTFTLRLPLNK